MDDGDDGNGGGGGGGGGNGGGQRPVIDLDTNLLELGLDSMTMFELHHMLERRVGQRISAKVLMENQTPRAMAAALVGKFGSTLGMEAPSSASGSSTTRSAFSSVDASISSLASSDEPETKVAASQKTSRPGCRKLSRARQWEQRRQHLQRDRHSTLPSSRRGLSNGGDDDDIGVTCGCFFPFRSPSRR
jgi:aryl carrier-like protein